jgi:hypothetical protein
MEVGPIRLAINENGNELNAEVILMSSGRYAPARYGLWSCQAGAITQVGWQVQVVSQVVASSAASETQGWRTCWHQPTPPASREIDLPFSLFDVCCYVFACSSKIIFQMTCVTIIIIIIIIIISQKFLSIGIMALLLKSCKNPDFNFKMFTYLILTIL